MCRYAKCRYAECRNAECHYAECRGATQGAKASKVMSLLAMMMQQTSPM